jgi:hypothetical protein
VCVCVCLLALAPFWSLLALEAQELAGASALELAGAGAFLELAGAGGTGDALCLAIGLEILQLGLGGVPHGLLCCCRSLTLGRGTGCFVTPSRK